MSEKDYYPAGAYDDPRAPYNQPPNPGPIDVSVDISISLSQENIIIQSDNYTEEPWEDWDTGDEGEIIHTGGTNYKYDCLEEDYKNSDFCIVKLLDEYADILKKKRSSISDSIITLTNCLDSLTKIGVDKKRISITKHALKVAQKKCNYLDNKINACTGIIIDDLNVCES